MGFRVDHSIIVVAHEHEWSDRDWDIVVEAFGISEVELDPNGWQYALLQGPGQVVEVWVFDVCQASPE